MKIDLGLPTIAPGSSQKDWKPLFTAIAVRVRPLANFVVMNNREYNILKNFSKSQPHYLSPRVNRFIATDITDPPIDFLALAAVMGVPARRIARAADIASAVEDGIASNRPNLIEIPISAT